MAQELICEWKNSLQTTRLLDQFEQRDEQGAPRFHSLRLDRCFLLKQGGCRCEVSLVLCRFDWRSGFRNDFMTFSRFKKQLGGKLFDETEHFCALLEELSAVFCEEGRAQLHHVVLLHAQNSGCRTGFGNSPAAGAVRYGRTNSYMITAVVFHKIE